MSTLKIEVPKNIAQNFVWKKNIPLNEFLDYCDEQTCTYYDVNMNIHDFKKELKEL